MAIRRAVSSNGASCSRLVSCSWHRRVCGPLHSGRHDSGHRGVHMLRQTHSGATARRSGHRRGCHEFAYFQSGRQRQTRPYPRLQRYRARSERGTIQHHRRSRRSHFVHAGRLRHQTGQGFRVLPFHRWKTGRCERCGGRCTSARAVAGHGCDGTGSRSERHQPVRDFEKGRYAPGEARHRQTEPRRHRLRRVEQPARVCGEHVDRCVARRRQR